MNEDCSANLIDAHCIATGTTPNETKMSDGGRRRASLAVKVWKSSQKGNVRRSAVRSIAWLGLGGFFEHKAFICAVPGIVTISKKLQALWKRAATV